MGDEKVLYNAVLVFPVKSRDWRSGCVTEVLLALKTKHIGAGCLNGYGGGIEAGETPRRAAVRELVEEARVARIYPQDLESVALMDFFNHPEDKPPFCCQVRVFLLHHWHGGINESAEMVNPAWWPVGDLPFSKMMLADRYWVGEIFAGKKFEGKVVYGPRQQSLLEPVQLSPCFRFDF